MNTGQLLPVRSLDGLKLAAGAPDSGSIRVFVSFDPEHDEHLYGLLLEQSRAVASGFEVLGSSKHLTDTGPASGRVRQQISEADQVIIICGEHTEASSSVYAELCIAREERTPYFLLWGQREFMCTKPLGAKPAEGMYSWTPQILQERLAYLRRTDPTGGAARGVRCNG